MLISPMPHYYSTVKWAKSKKSYRRPNGTRSLSPPGCSGSRHPGIRRTGFLQIAPSRKPPRLISDIMLCPICNNGNCGETFAAIAPLVGDTFFLIVPDNLIILWFFCYMMQHGVLLYSEAGLQRKWYPSPLLPNWEFKKSGKRGVSEGGLLRAF